MYKYGKDTDIKNYENVKKYRNGKKDADVKRLARNMKKYTNTN